MKQNDYLYVIEIDIKVIEIESLWNQMKQWHDVECNRPLTGTDNIDKLFQTLICNEIQFVFKIAFDLE